MREQPLVMPKMSMTMEEGQVIAWHKSEGDAVRNGDVVCEVMTDKVNMDVESTVDGTITRIVAQQGDSIPVGEPMAYIATESDDLFEGLIVGLEQPAAAAIASSDVPGSEAQAASGNALGDTADPRTATVAPFGKRKGPVPAAPLARRRAAELGIDLASVNGTGAGGTITRKDVEEAAKRLAAANKAVAPAPSEKAVAAPTSAVPQREATATGEPAVAFAGALEAHRRSVRRAVAQKMSESAAVPQFTAYTDLDLQVLAVTRGRIGWTPLLVLAVARTLRDHPMLNSVWQNGEPSPCAHIGIAVAVDTPVGLLAPVLVDPDQQSLDELAANTRQLVERARTGRLDADALQGATFTVSNLGGFGVRVFQALITPPQVAALSVGAIGEFPVGVGGGLAVRMTCSVGLTVDHRAADGADAGRFLADLRALLASPGRLLEPGRP